MSPKWLNQKRAEVRRRYSTSALLDFVPRVTPRWERPVWLRPYAEILERAVGGGLRVVVAAPPQHGKTQLTLHGLAQWAREHSHLRNVYATYSHDRADRVMVEAAPIFKRAGLSWTQKKGFWRFPGGGSILWTSLTGAITGQPVDGVFVIDDPFKDRKQANSAVYRQNAIDQLDEVVETRMHAGGSIVVMGTRWHPQDLSGVLVKRGWPYTNIKALADGSDDRKPGEALWPTRRTAESLERLRQANAYAFASLWQGEPRPRGAQVFGEPTYYDHDELPKAGIRVGYGLDLAYSEKTSADWSVLVRLLQVMRPAIAGVQQKPLYYVANAWREQTKAPDFARIVKARQREYRASAYFYCAGAEYGAADLMRERGVNITTMQADVDKFTRSQDCAEAWNEGRILWPSFGDAAEPPVWAAVGIDEIQNFTGVKDPHDDFVDALVSAFDGLERFRSDYDESFDSYLPTLRM